MTRESNRAESYDYVVIGAGCQDEHGVVEIADGVPAEAQVLGQGDLASPLPVLGLVEVSGEIGMPMAGRAGQPHR